MKLTAPLAKKADQLWSRTIREHGCCEACGSTWQLEAAHIIPRRFRATRWRRDNGLCLCHTCHQYFEAGRRFFVRWVKDHIGEDKYRELWFLAHDSRVVAREHEIREAIEALR